MFPKTGQKLAFSLLYPLLRSGFMKKMVLRLVTSVEKLLIRNGWVLIKTMRLLKRDRLLDLSYKGWDFVRYSSLELCAHEINRRQLAGAIAEVGVYQGEFAARVNEAFPDRTFYLYDTFAGFDEKDTTIEKNRQFSTGDEYFGNTSVELVLSRMQHPNQCVVRKGYFPETVGAESGEPFVFVSLDADLYKPLYDGLCFFYPRLVSGGFIFVHDFNNDAYSGAREAVTQFCQENNINYFPLSDIGGTAVLTK